MKVAVLLLALVASACAQLLTNYQEEFSNFIVKHNKVYDATEFQPRYAIFRANLDFINDYNAASEHARLGVNQFADLTHDEFKATMLGFSRSAAAAANVAANVTADGGAELHQPSAEVPVSQDWRASGAVTPVKDQGQCGSCWSFSTTGSIEGAWMLAGHKLVGLSEKNLMDCSASYGNQGCNGGLMSEAMKYVIANKGIDSEASYPYVPKDGHKCEFKASHVAATISSYKNVRGGSEADLLSAVGTVGPVSIAIDASHQSFQFYSSGVYYEPACSTTSLDHGVLAVGYGSESGKDYWLVKNSWNVNWGLEGYIKMSRNRGNNCGIASSATYPIV